MRNFHSRRAALRLQKSAGLLCKHTESCHCNALFRDHVESPLCVLSPKVWKKVVSSCFHYVILASQISSHSLLWTYIQQYIGKTRFSCPHSLSLAPAGCIHCPRQMVVSFSPRYPASLPLDEKMMRGSYTAQKGLQNYSQFAFCVVFFSLWCHYSLVDPWALAPN